MFEKMIKIKKFILFVLAIQLAMLGVVGLTSLGFGIPILRQLIGFIYLTFIPGLLILRIFKLHKIGCVETLLYSVGLSIAFLMFTGLFMNMFYPLIGISKPISILPLLVSITFIVSLLCIIVHKRESPETGIPSQNNTMQWSDVLSPPALFLFLLPILSALGAFLVYFYQINVVLLILLVLITLIAALVAFDKFIPIKLYPLAIIATSIALLWHWSLISFDLTGSDIIWEYIYQNSVLRHSIWNPDMHSNINAMLSIVMLAPLYSLILKLDTVWVFKIIYPILFSLVPVALFQAYRKQANDKIAFLSVFFFMSFPVFFSEMTVLARQQIAELFFALSILLFIDKQMATIKRAALLIIFGLSIVVSHYGLSYIYILYLLIALLMLFLWTNGTARELLENAVKKSSNLRRYFGITLQSHFQKNTLSGTYVLLFIVFCLAWYMYVSSGSAFDSIAHIGGHIYHSVRTDLFSPEARDPHIMQALGLAPVRGSEIEWSIARVFQYITQFFIVIGVIGLIANLHKMRFRPEYIAMCLTSMVLLAMCIIIPHFAGYLNMARIYHITLFFLAPLCILGGMTFFRCLSQILRKLRVHSLQNLITRSSLKMVVMLVLVPYFLFASGFIFELTGATPTSMPLSLYETDWDFFTNSEIHARTWLTKVVSPGAIIYCDSYASELLREKNPSLKFYGTPSNDTRLKQDSYIFLRRWNVLYGEVPSARKTGSSFGHTKLELNPADTNKIYDGGNAQILRCANGV